MEGMISNMVGECGLSLIAVLVMNTQVLHQSNGICYWALLIARSFEDHSPPAGKIP